MTTKIMAFEPGIYIEIDDVFTGVRKMARVTETGTSYEDLDDAGSTPFPIYEVLKPVEVGNILGWGLHLVDQRPDDYVPFKVLVDRLIHSGTDTLTYNRAAHWAFSHHQYNFETALAEGKNATEVVRTGRMQMDAILANAGIAS